MSITEARRTEMHIGLRESLGPRVADSLMEHLPPSGWGDVARQSEMILRFDMVQIQFEMIERRFEEIDRRLDAIEARMRFMIASGLTIGLALFGLQVQILLSLP
jgi:tetrahydromethanopterin S-methyltransferase subunit G